MGIREMRKYEAVFLAGDAVLERKFFYTPGEITNLNEVCILSELIDREFDLKEEYGCNVLIRVTPVWSAL